MIFGVDVFNNLKGTHNIALFERREEAVEFYEKLEEAWSGKLGDVDYDEFYQDAYENVLDVVEDVNWKTLQEVNRGITYYDNIDGHVTPVVTDVTIINLNDSVSIPS